MSEADRPKIIIDDDWKAQAQAEKAKLAEQERAKQTATVRPAAGGAPGPAAPGAPAESDEIGFQDLVQVLASQALLYMGAFPDPQSGRAVVSPPVARAHIDLLGVLEEKTRGNLTDEEKKLLEGVLHELRMQFVELGKAIDQAIKEGRISPAQAASMNSPGTPPGAAPGMPRS
ncbi:MAG TPA: DUF1844 domain-containing protein [Phycisphaerales bacterium]|nr:DUF1844 domain-containing protein [Phycisphaerales bacterium]